jgi:hypothetical protein
MRGDQIDSLDLMEAFAEKARMGKGEILKYYWEINMHNTAAGYRILAETLADYIVRLRSRGQPVEPPTAEGGPQLRCQSTSVSGVRLP